jgi:DNA-directed RNA polymerase specialized sigma subunit
MNPVGEFLKLSSKTRVKQHLRTSGSGRVSIVSEHDRDKSDQHKKDVSVQNKRRADRAALRAREHEMWRTWNEGGRKKEDLRPLLKSFAPLIKSKVYTYRGKLQQIPDSAIEMEFKLQFVNALKSYNPEKGTLSTYVYTYLDKAKRFIVETQNVARIPEPRAYKIRDYKRTIEELSEKLGRQPTDAEIAKKMKWRLAEVERMGLELRDDLITSGFVDDPTSIVPTKDSETLKMFRYELVGKEREVYDYLTGQGKPMIQATGKLAKELGMRDYQISRIKASIEKKFRKYQ